ncbi:sigma-70 family RNA polymerase sigma factor [Actinomycetospora sp. TBRC 11914]|uniref:sigma-70 family RNA polymerase sigma factor n=1 Tax=Actinomycetospora sp. TBRC 11914 TaxID=2729387 RepID=UPI00145F26C7|nr:sigma-70 family RNA polymerase sigma factor [Actinomycetospora sp. TBRC 11914]NMO91126.1 sigma-70 family RNA polymerase sigma factor [Actinomycetospora sp. TBRC 11914]
MPSRRDDHDVGVRMIDGLDDEEIVRRLVECSCEGPQWETVAIALWAFCFRAVEDMVMGGSLARRTEKLHRPIRLSDDEREALRRDPQDLAEMFSIAFEKQLDYFATCLLAGSGWRAGAGLPLRAYFLNGLLLHLRNPMRGWWRARRRMAVEVRMGDASPLEQYRDEDLGPEEWLIATEDIEALVVALHDFDPALCDAVTLRADTGWSWARIAQEVELSPNRLSELRRDFLEHLRYIDQMGGDHGS